MGSWTTGWDIALNPPIGSATSPVQGVVRDWGGELWNALSPSNPNGAAAGDGSTVDQSSINGTTTAAGAGCAEFPGPKTYIFNAQIKSNNGGTAAQTFAGTSRGGTVFKLANASAPDYHLAPWGAHVHYRDFTVDGNKANNPSSTSPSILLWSDNCSIDNVRSLNEKADGFNIQNNGCSVIASHVETPDGKGISLVSTASYTRIIGNRVDTPGSHGIFQAQSVESFNLIALNTVRNPGQIGIALGSQNTFASVLGNAVSGAGNNGIDTGSCLGVAVTANLISASTGPAINPDTGQRHAIIGNICQVGGILLSDGSTDNTGVTGRDHACGGNVVHDSPNTASQHFGQIQMSNVRYAAVFGNVAKNAHSPGGTVAAFYVTKNAGSASPDRLLLVGNIGYDDNTVKLQNYGIEIGAGSRSVTVAHNDFRGNLTAAVLDNGNDTYTHGVVGYNPRGRLAPPAIPASGVIFQNPFNVDCTVYIAGGTLTAIGVGGLPASATWGAQPTTTTTSTGGTLAGSTTYYYRCAARNAAGHTVECAEFSQVVGAGTNTNIVTITLPTGTGLRGVTGWDIYGRSTGAELLMATNWQKDIFVDDGSITPSGAMPGTDTTGNTAITGITAAAPAGAVHTVRVLYGQGTKITYSVVPTSWDWWGD